MKEGGQGGGQQGHRLPFHPFQRVSWPWWGLKGVVHLLLVLVQCPPLQHPQWAPREVWEWWQGEGWVGGGKGQWGAALPWCHLPHHRQPFYTT